MRFSLVQGRSSGRLISGFATLAIGILFNPWVATWLFSADRHLEAWSRFLVFGFDVFMIAVGLICLFASRAVIIGLLTSAVAGLVALAAVDLAARPLLRDQLYYRPEDVYKNRLQELPALSIFDRNVNYSGQTWGDLAAMTTQDSLREVRQVDFRTDDYGFRNDPSYYDTTKPLDLIILGDSFGAGTGTSQEEVWAALFHDKYGLNTYNLSMPGYAPWNELIMFKRELPRLKIGPRTTVLWAVFGGNDFDEPCFADLDPKPVGFSKRLSVQIQTFWRRSPLKMIAQRALIGLSSQISRDSAMVATLPDGRSILCYSQYVRHDRRSLDEVRQLPNLPKLRLVFEDMSKVTKEAGIKVLVAGLPTSYSIYGWVLDRTEPWQNTDTVIPVSILMAEMCRENGFDYVDLEPRMLSEARRLYERSGELLWWRDDTHWNKYGHALAAQVITDRLAGNVPSQAVEQVH